MDEENNEIELLLDIEDDGEMYIEDLDDSGSNDNNDDDGYNEENIGNREREGTGQANNDDEIFDPLLPLRHLYLGKNLEELHGRTLLDDNLCILLPLLPKPGVVLVPGQTLPLTVFQPADVSMLRNVISRDRTFGIISVRYLPDHVSKPADIGTTAEIYEFLEETDSVAGLSIKAKGRQRFKVLDTRRQSDGNIIGRVQILSEVVLPDPLSEVHFISTDKLCLSPTPMAKTPFPISRKKSSTTALVNISPMYRARWNAQKKVHRRNSLLTVWPSWIYEQHNLSLLTKRVKEAVTTMNELISLPEDPIELSFWVAHHLPLEDEQRLRLLRINSTVQRLRYELSMLEKFKVLCCQMCQCHIANQSDVFPMSVEGPAGTYCNPGGYVYDILTVYKVKGLRLVGRSETQHSWFPGYAWTIAECHDCKSHIGWKFTATKRRLKPEKFWGICRRAQKPGIKHVPGTQGLEDEFIPVM